MKYDTIWQLKHLPIRMTKHARQRMFEYQSSQTEIDFVIRTGRIIAKKARLPKACIAHYDGKNNTTKVVVVVVTKTYLKVLTTWQKKGK